jgi:Zn-dependent peptidase ImmA (M78 family)
LIDPLIQKLCARWDVKLPEAAILRAINSTFPGLQSAEPPVDVRSLAKRRGVTSIREIPMTVDGTISLIKGGGYQIELNSRHSESRKRFTCGHEIGHTFFFELEDEVYVKSRSAIDANLDAIDVNRFEEVLCNVAASEILMPRLSFLRQLNLHGPSAKNIIALSRRFKTSLWATGRRVIELCPLKLMIAQWEQRPEHECFVTNWILRSRNDRSSYKQLVVDSSSPVYQTFAKMPVFRGKRLMSLGGLVDDYFVDLIAIRQTTPRLLITVTIFESFASSLFGRATDLSAEPEQLDLY